MSEHDPKAGKTSSRSEPSAVNLWLTLATTPAYCSADTLTSEERLRRKRRIDPLRQPAW